MKEVLYFSVSAYLQCFFTNLLPNQVCCVRSCHVPLPACALPRQCGYSGPCGLCPAGLTRRGNNRGHARPCAYVKLPDRTQTLVIGNPIIADVTPLKA